MYPHSQGIGPNGNTPLQSLRFHLRNAMTSAISCYIDPSWRYGVPNQWSGGRLGGVAWPFSGLLLGSLENDVGIFFEAVGRLSAFRVHYRIPFLR